MKLITAVRNHKEIRLKISNHRKDGSPFVNDLSLHPVRDSNNHCQINVGVLAPADASAAAESLRGAIPTAFDAKLDPPTPYPVEPTDLVTQWKEFQKSTSTLVRLLWATEPDGAMRRLLALPPTLSAPAIASLTQFLEAKIKHHRFIGLPRSGPDAASESCIYSA